MNIMITNSSEAYRVPASLWVFAALGFLLVVITGLDALADMVARWETSEEYGYGYIIPVITLFLIWQRKDKLEQLRFTGSWLGFALLVFGVLVMLVGQLSAIYSVSQYGFVIAIIGAAYSILGWAALKMIIVPLLLLFLMVPLPGFVFNNLSAQLQLISSQLGVAVIRLFDISVHLEGNVIDLGAYKLQVVEACSGLRYLFPLVALSIIASYFYQAPVWKRLVVILSSIPITVFMNSFRIGVIGVLVDNFGIEQAEGFLHDFEGWIVFMACVGVLIFEIWLLSLFGKDRRPFREIFGMEFPMPQPDGTTFISRKFPVQAGATIIVLVAGALAGMAASDRAEIVPSRTQFAEFPATLGEWHGQSDALESVVLDVLKLDDYLLSDYRNRDGYSVNMYVAYYGSQRSGASTHSPRTCLPGGGWRIDSHTHIELPNGIRANRFLITMGDNRQLVYYWFKQRDRIITDEFAVKWYMLWDSLTRNRTDGALLRLTTVLQPGEEVGAGDARLRAFAQEVVPHLTKYVPD